MDAILAATTIRQKRQALDRMANGLGLQEAYNTTLARIRQQDEEKSKLGMAALMLVSRCERPLRSKELCHALGVDLVVEEFTVDNVPSVRTVLGCTLGLVTIDENASTVRLLHLTLREYLRESATIFETPQSMMAEICLTYLNSPSARRPLPDLYQTLEELPFLEYATHFWATHAAREVTEQVKSRAFRLLDGYESHVSAMILLRDKRWRGWHGEDVRGISGLHCIAFLGIAEITIPMLEANKWDVNGRDSRGDTPLMWAVRYGNDKVVELLLGQRDIKPDVAIRGGRAVFSFAAELGNEGAVKLLLQCRGVNPDLLDSNGRSSLSYAAAGGHESVLKLLLEPPVDPNSSDGSGRTPLSFAASEGHEWAVKLLLGHKDVNPGLSDSNGQTPLSLAASSGHEGVVKLLLGRGYVNSQDSNGQTPLSLAASGGHEGVVKLLLEREDVSLGSLDSNGQTPLSLAASRGHEGVVRLLLGRRDVNSDSRDSNDQTPLSLAGSRGHEGVVKLLLECEDVNPNSLDRNGQAPLSLAASRGHEGVVRLLIRRQDVNPDSRDSNNQTPLSLAASGGHEGVVRLLLKCEGVNPSQCSQRAR